MNALALNEWRVRARDREREKERERERSKIHSKFQLESRKIFGNYDEKIVLKL